MPAIQFIMSGGMANIGGNLADAERKLCDNIVRKFGECIKTISRQQHVPGSVLTVFQATFLFIGKDKEKYFFIFAFNHGSDTINYTDLSQHGSLTLDRLIEDIMYNVGAVTWGFTLPITSVVSSNIDTEVENIAKDYIQTLTKALVESQQNDVDTSNNPELAQYIKKFRADYPSNTKIAFIMMQFSNTAAHVRIVQEVKRVLKKHNIIGLRADDKEYTDDLFSNVRVYMHCSSFGIAVFERLLADDFNPNVSLEVGYIFGLNKSVCLLKDQTLKKLPTDLVGKLYKEFDPQNIDGTIETQLEKWLQDKGFI